MRYSSYHFIVCGHVPWLYWPGGFKVLWFSVQEHPKAQPAAVLVLKRLRRRGNRLKYLPTDWEKPGIEPATPGLQDIGLSPTPRRLLPFYADSFETLPVLLSWSQFLLNSQITFVTFSVLCT